MNKVALFASNVMLVIQEVSEFRRGLALKVKLKMSFKA